MATGFNSNLRTANVPCHRTGQRLRRMLTLACIVGATFPVANDSGAQQTAPLAEQQLAGPASQQMPMPRAERALYVDQPGQQSAVMPTAGGLLGNLFRSNETGAGRGDKDDGRKAHPLPPPDPSTINWSGVPYHSPEPGPLADSAGDPKPIRDRQGGAAARSGSGSSRATSPSSRSGTNSAIPQPPSASSLSTRPSSARSQDTPQAASSSQPKATTGNEFSHNTSSRRRGRRPVDPLSVNGLMPATVDQQSEALSDADSAPRVARRELPAAEPNDPLATVPSRRRTSPPTVPPSLEDSPGKPSSAKPDEIAESSSGGQATARLSDQSIEQPKAAQSPLPQPVNRSTPLTPPPGAKAYPDDSLAAQIIPLRPLAGAPLSVNSQGPGASENDERIGSGIATGNVDELPPADPAQPKLDMAAVAQPDSNPGKPAKSTGKTLAVSEMPGIRVITEGPPEVLVHQLNQYELRVENRGAIDATGVMIVTKLPPWAEVQGHNASTGTLNAEAVEAGRQIEWTIDSLPAGVVERLFIRIKASQGGTFDIASQWTALPQEQRAEVTVLQPRLAVEIEGPDEIVLGQSQKYRIRVLNPGNGTAANVSFALDPTSGDPVPQPLGDLPPGKEASFEIELTAQDDADLEIVGTASGDLDLQAEVNKTVQVVAAKIEAILTGPPVRFQNTEATYQLELVNQGQATARDVRAELQLPAGVEYIGGIEDARHDGDKLVWKLPALAAGESRQFEFSCRMNQSGNQQLAVHCEGSAAARATVSLQTKVEAIADLKLTVIDPPAPAPVGTDVTYELVINNRGSKAAEQVRVVAQFSHGIEPLRLEGHTGDVVTGQVLFAPIPEIAPGDQLKLKVIAKADSAGDHRFRAEVRSGEIVLVAEEATVFVDTVGQRISSSSSENLTR